MLQVNPIVQLNVLKMDSKFSPFIKRCLKRPETLVDPLRKLNETSSGGPATHKIIKTSTFRSLLQVFFINKANQMLCFRSITYCSEI